ncbi:hypothetical protein, partial [Tabrizicola flagellatus]|uniref:hypothetical protein n=1 Tax=Tabrizicola flagellatus TaxID=2593021 RepID=UPI0011F2829C
MGIRHAYSATGPNDSGKQVSVDRWNEDHVLVGPITLGGVASDPGAPADGMLWLNTTTGEVKVRSAGTTRLIGLSPGGASGEIQFNNAGAFGGAADVEIEGGQLRLPT